jgi:hypothetical protein
LDISTLGFNPSLSIFLLPTNAHQIGTFLFWACVYGVDITLFLKKILKLLQLIYLFFSYIYFDKLSRKLDELDHFYFAQKGDISIVVFNFLKGTFPMWTLTFLVVSILA